MTNTLATWFAENLGQVVPAEVVIFIVSLLPILECRGGLIVASLLKVNILRALPICIIGNIIPVPFLLLLIRKIFNALKKTKAFNGIVTKLENRAIKKSDALARGEFVGLLLFVGVPLPGTGAWTGSLLAELMGIKRKTSFTAILLGVLIAAFIISVIFYGLLGNVL